MKNSSLRRRSMMRSKSPEPRGLPGWTWGLVAAVFSVVLFVAGNAFSESKGEVTEVASASTAGTINLETLSAEQKRDLLRRKQQFEQLGADEQNKLRQLHHSLSAEPDAPQLTAVMSRYHQWLMTLRPLERDELLSMPAEERIRHIRDMLQRQEKE